MKHALVALDTEPAVFGISDSSFMANIGGDNMNFVGTPQAGERLGISRKGVWWLIKNGRLKAHRTGRDWAVDAKSIEEYKEQRNDKRNAGTSKKQSGGNLWE